MDGSIRNLILDMDGVLWRGETPIPGLAAFFAMLGELGIGFVLATNNATQTAAQYTAKLARFGVDMPPEQIITSAEATALYLRRRYPADTLVYAVGETGLRDAIVAQGFSLLPARLLSLPARSVVAAGLSREVCYDDLATAALLIRGGADFVGTNPDLTLPTERGQMPGAGAILAFLAAASGAQPVLIGKPGRFLFEEGLRRLKGDPADTVAVGDRLETDIAGGQAAGLRTVLVLSGVSTAAEVAAGPIKPDWIFEDITALAAYLLQNSHSDKHNGSPIG